MTNCLCGPRGISPDVSARSKCEQFVTASADVFLGISAFVRSRQACNCEWNTAEPDGAGENALQEAGRLTQVPGIGKKTAERLCLELKGKLAPDLGITGGKPQAIEASSEVLQALLALGYSEKEALLALKQIPPETNVSDGIRMGLKYLSKA